MISKCRVQHENEEVNNSSKLGFAEKRY